MNKQEIWAEMKRDHEAWKDEWYADGAPGDFYNWLLERVEKALVAEKMNEGKK